MITEEEQKKLQSILRETVVCMADLNDMEKTVSRLRNEANEIYDRADKRLDEAGFKRQ